MNIVYIKETEETCDIIKRMTVKIKKVLNIINYEINDGRTIYYLPVFRDTKISKYRIKKIYKKINRLLERDGTSNIVLSEYLYTNQLLKNYLYAENINILNGRYLFKCLTYKIIEYIFKLKNKKKELRRNFIINK